MKISVGRGPSQCWITSSPAGNLSMPVHVFGRAPIKMTSQLERERRKHVACPIFNQEFTKFVGSVSSFQSVPSTRSVKTQALTESSQLPLDSPAPDFTLPEPLTGKLVSLADFQGCSALLVIFMCNHCPFVKLLKDGLVSVANDYEERGVRVVGISSNSVELKPQDGPQEMAADAKEQGYPFPYLFDEDQKVAEVYQAECTPEFFLFDPNFKLQYHGQFDAARPSNGLAVTGKDVRRAIDSLLAGEGPIAKVTPSIGCNIKWHPGRTPAHAL